MPIAPQGEMLHRDHSSHRNSSNTCRWLSPYKSQTQQVTTPKVMVKSSECTGILTPSRKLSWPTTVTHKTGKNCSPVHYLSYVQLSAVLQGSPLIRSCSAGIALFVVFVVMLLLMNKFWGAGGKQQRAESQKFPLNYRQPINKPLT